MKLLKRLFKDVFPIAVVAGVIVGIAGTIFLSQLGTDNKLLGAFLFSGGLLIVCVHSLNLFTGKVGYLVDNKPIFILDLIVMILGNVIGALIIVFVVRMANIEIVINTAGSVVAEKVSKEWHESLGLAILCGIMMYIAVEGYKRVPNDIAKVFLVIFSAMIFLMAGFEHSLANIYYFMLSGTFELKAFLYVLIMLLGNAIGAIGFNLLEKAAKLKR